MRTLVSNGNLQTKIKTLHCAIYTRKSTDEGLGQEFTSLDSQREYCEAFVKSRELEGWRPYLERYDDGGFSGGNTNRPALKKLLADARQGKFQIVVCYKYDRLSRNTRDFLAILDVFDRSGVAFVSVTQPIDTTSSVGRLMRSILMDFSQFEREMISERTRDKLHAMAKRGKRTGGYPIIGYDIDPEKKSLKVNPEEKLQALEMFDAYNRTKSLSVTAEELNKKGYRMKAWVTRKGLRRGGQKFNKASLWYLLQNPLYIGKITHRKEIYPGEHEAIVPLDTFEAAQRVLRANGNGKLHRQVVDRKHVFLLRGLVKCACCETAMTPFSALSKKNSEGHRRFFYYKCLSVVKGTRDACATRYIGAEALESYVIRRLGELAASDALVDRIVEESQQTSSITLPLKFVEKKRLSAEKGKVQGEIESLVGILAKEGGTSHKNYQMIMDMLGNLKDRREELELKISVLNLEIERLESQQIDSTVLQRNLQNFLQVFNKLDDDQKAELVAFMVKQVIWDKVNMWVTIELRAAHPLFGDLNQLTGRFDYRQTSLRGSNDNQTAQSSPDFDYRQTSLRD